MRVITLIMSLTLLSGCYTFSNTFSRFVGVEPPKQLVVANEYVGLEERKDRTTLKEFLGVDPVNVEWCAAFVNSVLTEVGLESTKSLMARSYLNWGTSTDTPSPGDIMVFSRGNNGWSGHVGFYVATVNYKDKEYWIVLGGNQNNTVSYRLYQANHWRHLDTRTLLDEPSKAIMLNQQWMLDGIPLEFVE